MTSSGRGGPDAASDAARRGQATGGVAPVRPRCGLWRGQAIGRADGGGRMDRLWRWAAAGECAGSCGRRRAQWQEQPTRAVRDSDSVLVVARRAADSSKCYGGRSRGAGDCREAAARASSGQRGQAQRRARTAGFADMRGQARQAHSRGRCSGERQRRGDLELKLAGRDRASAGAKNDDGGASVIDRGRDQRGNIEELTAESKASSRWVGEGQQ